MSATKKTSAKAAALETRVKELSERFAAMLPNPVVELDFEDAWQLLIATILAAQSTDKRVNMTTPELFKRWPTPKALGDASQEDVEEVVKSTGFFRNKAKAIREASRMIAERFGGEVPRTMEEVTSLPGVARKTANVVLGSAYGLQSGFIVDTHVGRVSRRLGLTKEEDPEKVEEALCALFPRAEWIVTAHRMVLHGRYLCLAKKPDCARCPVNELCPSAEKEPEGSWKARAEREGRLIMSRGAVTA